MRKKRVLVLSEAAYLNTGYATYSRELLTKLKATNKYEVAEFSIYGSLEDPRRKEIPWKNYPCMPDPNSKEENENYHSNPVNQFGAWRFERVCLDFKPDCVLDIRDTWMSSFVLQSSYRRFFKFFWMGAVDAFPQSEEWISHYSKCDKVFNYSDFGVKTLTEHGLTNLGGRTSPGPVAEYTPVLNKREYKQSLGINPDWKIVGTVMRNQRRKLFPDLFEAFSRYLKRSGDAQSYLYCHTSYPDNGWNIPKYLIKSGITSRVLFTYICENCGFVHACKFSDTVQQCPQCHQFRSKTANVAVGLSPQQLASVYRLFDLYVQPVNSEGFGIPVAEAAGCGIPILCTDYASCEDFVDKLDAYPIKVQSLYNELETGCNRATPEIQDIADKLYEFLSLPEPIRLQKSLKTIGLYKENYSWDLTSGKWMAAIDEAPLSNWETTPHIVGLPTQIPQFGTNKEFVDWCIGLINDPSLQGSYEHLSLLRDLNFGMFRNGPGGYFYSDNSAWGRENYKILNHEILFNIIRSRVEKDNFWERARVGMITLPREKWLEDHKETK